MGRSFDLLIVDDDAAQVSVLGVLLQQMGMPHSYHHCSSGKEALDFLHRRHPYEQAPRPQLILLDLNMPAMDGCEVLRRVKSDPQLRCIPVVMLSSSRALKDIDACYCAHANAYMTKPMDLEGNMALLRHLDQYWNACELPPR
ncbi:MAG: response regulator [Bryobacteraceae bacterium]